MRLSEPLWLILLVLTPLPWFLARSRPRLAWPSLDGFGPIGRRRARFKSAIPLILRGLLMASIAVALARPQTIAGTTRIAAEGVAMVVALDQSSSMTTADFPDRPDRPSIPRLNAAKMTLTRFLAGRPDDLIGLVVFANYPDLACPPTLDHGFLRDTVESIRTARPGDDGTNLGDAMIVAIEALKEAPTRKKVLILLTDGRNSPAVPRPTDPAFAASLASRLGIIVHTVAVGRGPTRAVEPVTNLSVTLDEGPDLALLERLAQLGHGQSFVAADANALQRVFATIDALEKSPVRGEIRTRYREHYAPLAALALALLVVDRLLASGRLRQLP